MFTLEAVAYIAECVEFILDYMDYNAKKTSRAHHISTNFRQALIWYNKIIDGEFTNKEFVECCQLRILNWLAAVIKAVIPAGHCEYPDTFKRTFLLYYNLTRFTKDLLTNHAYEMIMSGEI